MSGFGKNPVKIVITCHVCEKEQPAITIEHRQLTLWRNGEKIQKAMPNLSNAERELLISATCDPCWDKMWKEEDE